MYSLLHHVYVVKAICKFQQRRNCIGCHADLLLLKFRLLYRFCKAKVTPSLFTEKHDEACVCCSRCNWESAIVLPYETVAQLNGTSVVCPDSQSGKLDFSVDSRFRGNDGWGRGNDGWGRVSDG